jgi:hypothetical protein
MTSSEPNAGRFAREDVPMDGEVTMDFQGKTGSAYVRLASGAWRFWLTRIIPLKQVVGLLLDVSKSGLQKSAIPN